MATPEIALAEGGPPTVRYLQDRPRISSWAQVGFTTLIWITLFTPMHMASGLAGYLFLVGLCLFAMGVLAAGKTPAKIGPIPVLYLVGALGFLTLIYTSTYAINVFVFEMETGPRDFFEVTRFVIYGLIILSVLTCMTIKHVVHMERAIVFAYLFAVFVGLCFLINIPIFSTLFQDIIYSDTKTAMAWGGRIRLSAPLENPNYLGFLIVLSFCYLLFFSRLSAAALFAGCIVLFFTGSRTAWFSFIGVIALYYMYVFSLAITQLKWKRLIKALIAIGLVLFIVIWNWDAISEGNRVSSFLRILESGSLFTDLSATEHLANYARAFENFAQAPILGTGPSKYAVMDVVDNQFLLWLMRNGLVGTLMIIGFLIGAFIFQFRCCRTLQHQFGVFAFWGASFGFYLTGAFLNNFRLAMIFALLIGAISCRISEVAQQKRALRNRES